MTAPLMAKAQFAPKIGDRATMPVSDVTVEPPAVAAAPAMPVVPAPSSPAVLPASPFRLASADPRFEAALTALAMKPPAEFKSEEEAVPTIPFEGKAVPKPAEPERSAPEIAVPAETAKPAKPAVAAPPANDMLPKLTDVLPRPRPPLTPAQELGLEGKERAKAEQCLARAIYFEARNEPVRGQIGVAQVVLNRVFSPYYPGDVCGVVYQNAHRRLSCQFTFACDGIPDLVREKGPWVRAQRIAKQALDAQVWLPDVAKSTHYHATYVRPYWIREMKKMVKHGQHIFYRPHRWGDGSDEVGWGVASLQFSQKAKTSKN